MKIAVLGAGNSGCAIAADLSLRNHEVTLIKTSQSIHDENFDYILKNENKITIFEKDEYKEAKIYKITRDLKEIIDKQLVCIFIQSNYHEDVIKRIAPYIQDNQTILVNPGYLSTAFILKYIKNKDITVAEAQSSFIDCRIVEPGLIKVGFRNVRNPIGIFPSKNKTKTKKLLDATGFPLTYLNNVIEAALHNPNLIVHTVGAILSIPRIEKTNGDYCMYHEVFTPAVWRILEKLDGEKMDILEKLGCERLPYVEACKFRNSLDDTRDAKEVFFWYAAMPTRAKGPTSIYSRYITEDVPQGLVMLESLGKHLNISTPITTSLIELASSALVRDFRKEGRSLERLGKTNLDEIMKRGSKNENHSNNKLH